MDRRIEGESIVTGGNEQRGYAKVGTPVSTLVMAFRDAGCWVVGTRDNMPYRRHLLVAAASDVAWPASGPGYKRIAACMNRAARTRRGTPGIKSALSYYNRIMASSDPTPQKRPCRGDVTPRRSATRCSVNTYTVSYPTLLLFAILFARGNNFFSFQTG